MKKNVLCILTIMVLLTVTSLANSQSAKILLPDGNGAPLATVTIGDKVFKANEKGEVEITFDSEKKALLKWLDLAVEVPIEATMKFPNKVLCGPPYDALDWVVNGPDTWEFDKKIILNPGGQNNESQIFLDEDFSDFVIRSKFIAEKPSQWFYVRFFMRAFEEGFNGYGISFAASPSDQTFFTRFEGSWEKYTKVIDPIFVYSAIPEGIPVEFVGFLKNDHILIYLRVEGEKEYKKIVDAVDNSEGAFYDGGISILNSFCDLEISELGVFKY